MDQLNFVKNTVHPSPSNIIKQRMLDVVQLVWTMLRGFSEQKQRIKFQLGTVRTNWALYNRLLNFVYAWIKRNNILSTQMKVVIDLSYNDVSMPS